MKLRYFKIVTVISILAALIIVSIFGISAGASAASAAEFSNTNSAILSAYASVYSAQVQKHGDVSNLVLQLNNAAQLLNTAREENSTNPAAAASDLQTALTIAQQVSTAAGAASVIGAKINALQRFESIGAAVAIIAGAGLIYIASDYVHRKWWVHTYRDYSVRLKKDAS